MLLFLSASETSSDEMASCPPTADSPTRRRTQAVHRNHPQSRAKKRARGGVSRTDDGLGAPARQLDINWPGNLNTVDSNTEKELEHTQHELQGEYSQIDPILLNLSFTNNAHTPSHLGDNSKADQLVAPSVSEQHATLMPQSSDQALVLIQNEAHLNRLQLQRNMDKGKGTNEAYPRHVKNYEKFWEADQDRRGKLNPNHVRTPAHPIIGEKVSLFLHYEMSRNKVILSAFVHS